MKRARLETATRRAERRLLPLFFPLRFAAAALARARRWASLSDSESGCVGTNSRSNSFVAAASSLDVICQYCLGAFLRMTKSNVALAPDYRRLRYRFFSLSLNGLAWITYTTSCGSKM